MKTRPCSSPSQGSVSSHLRLRSPTATRCAKSFTSGHSPSAVRTMTARPLPPSHRQVFSPISAATSAEIVLGRLHRIKLSPRRGRDRTPRRPSRRPFPAPRRETRSSPSATQRPPAIVSTTDNPHDARPSRIGRRDLSPKRRLIFCISIFSPGPRQRPAQRPVRGPGSISADPPTNRTSRFGDRSAHR